MMSDNHQISSLGAWRLTLAAGIFCFGLAAPGADVTAGAIGTELRTQDVGIRSLNQTPVAPRGGVMMLPLTRSDERTPWPRQMTLVTADGRTLEGHVAVMHARPPRPAASAVAAWTRDPRGLTIRAPGDDDRAGYSGAVLLLRVPQDGSGSITLGRQRLEPIWRDLPVRATFERDERPIMPRVPALDRPDPDSPFEHWRWVLFADRLDQTPPSTDVFEPLAAMLAEHFADLWHIGIARLAAESPGLAQHVRELLTRTCKDGDVPFAAWVADPNQTAALLNHLLNVRRAGRAFIEDVVAWTEEHERVRFWIESDAGDVVRLAVINPGVRPALVRFDWTGSDLPPLAVQVEAGTLRRVRIDRPAPPEMGHRRPLEPVIAGTDRPARPDVLAVTAGGRTVSLPLRPRFAPVNPPGHWLPILRPALTLAEVQGGPPAMVAGPIESATTAHLRRLRGRWEVFIESRRPSAFESDRESERPSPTSIDEARGREAIILSISRSPDEPSHVLIVPETGWHHLLHGARGEGDTALQIHRRSHEDHWVCRIVLPDAWLGLLPGQATHVSVMRTRRGTPGIDFSPMPALPWRPHPAPAALDLSEWLDLPVGR